MVNNCVNKFWLMNICIFDYYRQNISVGVTDIADVFKICELLMDISALGENADKLHEKDFRKLLDFYCILFYPRLQLCYSILL